MKLTINDKPHEVSVDGETITVDGRPFAVKVEGAERRRTVRVGERPYQVELPEATSSPMSVLVDGKAYRVEAEGFRGATARPAPPRPQPRPASSAPGAVVARMAGRILRVAVTPGDTVQAGDLLLVFEAMKMENEIHAPQAGSIKTIAVTPGQRVSEGETLLVLE
ncbi:MAG: biotin/lipoyl-containing protein [Dehalococcoidia bacterium]